MLERETKLEKQNKTHNTHSTETDNPYAAQKPSLRRSLVLQTASLRTGLAWDPRGSHGPPLPPARSRDARTGSSPLKSTDGHTGRGFHVKCLEILQPEEKYRAF